MNKREEIFQKAKALIAKNPQYKLEAYAFVMSGLEYTVRHLPEQRHVTGQELCEGLRRYALDQFGPMAKTVLEHWGVTKTEDFGEIVYILIEAGLMRKTEEDSKADFNHVYDFEKAFSVPYELDDTKPA